MVVQSYTQDRLLTTVMASYVMDISMRMKRTFSTSTGVGAVMVMAILCSQCSIQTNRVPAVVQPIVHTPSDKKPLLVFRKLAVRVLYLM